MFHGCPFGQYGPGYFGNAGGHGINILSVYVPSYFELFFLTDHCLLFIWIHVSYGLLKNIIYKSYCNPFFLKKKVSLILIYSKSTLHHHMNGDLFFPITPIWSLLIITNMDRVWDISCDNDDGQKFRE